MKNTNQPFVNTSLQEFGNLIITNYDLSIVAISDSVLKDTPLLLEQLLAAPLASFLTSLFNTDCSKFLKLLQAVIDKKIPRQVFLKKIGDQYYYFKLNTYKGFVYIEWEKQLDKHISVSGMSELGFLFDEIYINNWNFLCKALHKLLKFDRIFVLRIQDTGHSTVIAEHCSHHLPSFAGKEFSEDFLPQETLPYFKSLSYRYIPNLDRLEQTLHSIDPNIHILCSQLAPPPRVHELFFKHSGVCAVLFFPLYLDGKFWGLVAAHHHKPRKVDLQQRKLGTFIAQSAMSRFENSFKQELIEQNQQLQKTETLLKQSLANNRTINGAMVQNMELLTNMVKADGLAIYNQGDVFFHGDVPTMDSFYKLIQYFQENIDKTIFKDYNFRQTYGSHFTESLPFAGLLFYTLGTDKDYYLVWFRKENISSAIQIDIAEVAEKTKVHTWEQPIHDWAESWDDTDLKFIQTLQHVIEESIISKSPEKQMLTEELRTLNNELEMFTFSLSHDLKNPLSILKMGLQFLQTSGKKIQEEKKDDWIKNLLDSVSNIEDIINNIVSINQSRTAAMTKDPIPMFYIIQKIVQESILLYNPSNCRPHFGRLLPVWGEKSALYQIFLNIIGNAIKYSRTQEKQEIWIDSIMDEQHVCYSIKDNGIGIPADTLPYIFDIFIRASNAQSFTGSGVGLSLVKRIMDRLGGDIQVDSSEDKGTHIKLYFPLTAPFPASML